MMMMMTKERAPAAAALAVAVAAVALFTTAAAQTAVGEWDTSLPDLPADPRHHPITFTLGDTGYVMMGTTRADIFAYNASSASWAAPRLRSGLPPWREFAYGVSVGGGAFGETAAEQVAFLGLGRAGSSVLSDWYMFDGESFYQRAPMPAGGRYHPAMVAVETARGWSVFVGAGGGVEGNLRDWYEYSVDDDTWTRRADLPGAARHHPFYWDARVRIDGGEVKHYAYVGFGHGASAPRARPPPRIDEPRARPLTGARRASAPTRARTGYGTPLNPRGIFRDVYRYDADEDLWEQMADFPGEARVAGTQFTVHADAGAGRDRPFVLSGDGDDHGTIETGELWEYLGTPARTPRGAREEPPPD